MGITASNRAAGVSAQVQATVFKADASVIPRNVLVAGTGLPASYTANGVVVGVPVQILSSAQASNLYGAGSMLARLLASVLAGSNGAVKVWALPETETGAAAAGVVTFTASTPTAGTLPLYVAGKVYNITTATTDTPTTLSSKAQALLNADPDCPVIAAGTTTLTLTAKSKGPWGNSISLSIASAPGDTLPSGIGGSVTTAMTGGSGIPTLATDLANGLGTGSQANLLPNGQWVTDLVHGYLQDQTTLAAISAYNETCWDGLCARPFRSLTADVLATGGAALTALVAIGTTNRADRTNGIIAVPGSLTHPSEIAGIAIGVIAKINNKRAQDNYVGQILPGVDPGYACKFAGNRWTDQYANRDTAVQGGISPTVCVGAVVELQNVVSFYHPANVAAANNIYAEFANLSKSQNILASLIATFSSSKWTGFTVTADTADVTDIDSRVTARDIESVRDDWVALIETWAKKAWIYSKDFSMSALKNKAQPAIAVRTDGTGFTCNVPVILSGTGNIIDSTVSTDISLAVLAN